MELQINIDQYLKKFRVFNPTSLFQPTAVEIVKALKDKRCPICQRKLKIDMKGNGRCASKFKDKFFISKVKLDKYIA